MARKMPPKKKPSGGMPKGPHKMPDGHMMPGMPPKGMPKMPAAPPRKKKAKK